MKKNRLLSIAALLLLFTACGGYQEEAVSEAVPEITSIPETSASEKETSAKTASETILTDDISETMAEASENSEASSETSEVTTAKTEAEPEPQQRYCKMHISTENVISSEEKFSESNAAELEAAKDIVLASSRYAEDKAACSIESKTFEPLFTEAITADFDHNGTEECFFFLTPDGWCGPQGPSSYLFRSDEDGVRLISDSYYYVQDNENETAFSEIVYDDFSHLLVTVGYNNFSRAASIYSIDGDETKLENDQVCYCGTSDSILLNFTEPMSPTSWFIYWDNIDKCYKTPAFIDLTKEQIDAVPGLSEILSSSDEADADSEGNLTVSLLGKKYYGIFTKEGQYPVCDTYYIDDNGILTESGLYLGSYSRNSITPMPSEEIDIPAIVRELQDK